MNIVRTGVISVWKRSWTFLGVILQHFGSRRDIRIAFSIELRLRVSRSLRSLANYSQSAEVTYNIYLFYYVKFQLSRRVLILNLSTVMYCVWHHLASFLFLIAYLVSSCALTLPLTHDTHTSIVIGTKFERDWSNFQPDH